MANKSGGFSSESLSVAVVDADGRREYVVRIPPTGGGLYPDYDLKGQAQTQELLHVHGIATPSPSYYEPDTDWIGAPFLVMPKIGGHIPGDMTYARKGWLHDAGAQIQRRAHESFLSALAVCSAFRSARRPGWPAQLGWATRPKFSGGASTCGGQPTTRYLT